jgi:hypothetical protein
VASWAATTRMTRQITERMADARRDLIEKRKRCPRVFFLGPKDFDEFAATKPTTVEAMFALPLGSKPTLMTCLSFQGIAVRATDRAPGRDGRIRSNLYCTRGISILVPWD